MCHNLCEKLNNEWHFWLFLDDLIKELEDEEIVFVGSACSGCGAGICTG
jgi:hypothetical protein